MPRGVSRSYLHTRAARITCLSPCRPPGRRRRPAGRHGRWGCGRIRFRNQRETPEGKPLASYKETGIHHRCRPFGALRRRNGRDSWGLRPRLHSVAAARLGNCAPTQQVFQPSAMRHDLAKPTEAARRGGTKMAFGPRFDSCSRGRVRPEGACLLLCRPPLQRGRDFAPFDLARGQGFSQLSHAGGGGLAAAQVEPFQARQRGQVFDARVGQAAAGQR